MQQKLMTKTAIFSFIFSAIVLIVVFFALENRDVLAGNRYGDYLVLAEDDEKNIPENAYDIIDVSEHPGQSPSYPLQTEEDSEEPDEQSLAFELGNADTNYLAIPVPAGIRLQDIKIDNHYLEDEMRIVINGADSDFYTKNAISGNRRNIMSGTYEITENGVILIFSLNDIYEYRSIMEENKVYVEFVPPREMYDRIIVIDAAFGGSESGIEANDLLEKDVALSIAAKLKELLDQTEYKVYYTRDADNNLSDEKRVRIANNVKADMLIRIQADGDEDSMVYGTTAIYNENFFIPRFGSIELANILETEVVLSIRGKAIGLQKATADDYVVNNATVPAAALKVGYLTNAQEAILLKREDYIEKIAMGIYNAIVAAYESH
jgi:N-acetylmuramoyl-L-alanine amidase